MDHHRPALNRRVVRLVGFAPAVFLAVFFVWPVVAIVGRGLSGGGLVDVITDPILVRIAWFTLWQAVASTLLTLLVGLPVAFVLARYQFRGRRGIESLLVVPFVLPTVVVGTAFLALLPNSWHGTVEAVLIAHVYFNVSVVVRTLTPVWRQVDGRLTDAARTLGATPWQSFRRVVAPILQPALRSAASIVFMFTFTSFGVVLFLGGPRHPTLEVEIYRRTAQLLDLRSAAALALIQVVCMAAVLGLAGRRPKVAIPRRFVERPTSFNAWVVLAILVPAVVAVLAPLVALATRAGQWRALFTGRPFDALVTSAFTALVAAGIATLLGCAAGVCVNAPARSSRLLEVLLSLPLGTSAVTVGFGLLVAFSGPLLDLRGNRLVIPVAHAIIGLPFVMRLVTAALRDVHPRQRDAAATLGASPWQVWRTVDWTALRRPAALGAGFAFAVSVGEFGASVFLVRRGNPTLPTLINETLGRPGASNNQLGHAMAVVLALLSGGALYVVDRMGERWKA